MKKFTVTLSILCALCAITFAGSESYSGKEMRQTAAVAQECPNWSGFYVGVFGGYKFASTNPRLDLGGDWDFAANGGLAARGPLEARGSEDLDFNGGDAGGLIGFNWQFNKWVIGLEGTGAYTWLRDSNQTDIFTIPGVGDTYDVTTSFKTHYLATFGPRLGYAFCKVMPYVTGGLALGDLDYFQQIKEHNIFFEEGGNRSDTNVGWFVGGGLEYMLNQHWSIRGQYEYVDLGDTDIHHVGTAPFAGFTGTSRAELREHNASVALMYHF